MKPNKSKSKETKPKKAAVSPKKTAHAASPKVKKEKKPAGAPKAKTPIKKAKPAKAPKISEKEFKKKSKEKAHAKETHKPHKDLKADKNKKGKADKKVPQVSAQNVESPIATLAAEKSLEKETGKKPKKLKGKALAKAKAAAKQAFNSIGQKIDSHGNILCREAFCETLSSLSDYCRLHYIKNWRKVKRKELILKERKLNRYIEELVAKYPEKYIDVIRQDLSTDHDFNKVVQDLEITTSLDDIDSDIDSIDNIIDNIRRDIDDEGGGGEYY